jgi:hypothetical protein
MKDAIKEMGLSFLAVLSVAATAVGIVLLGSAI